MKIKSVTMTIDRKITDGDYGSYGASVTLEAEVEKDDDPKEVRQKLRVMALKEVDATIKAAQEKLPKAKKK